MRNDSKVLEVCQRIRLAVPTLTRWAAGELEVEVRIFETPQLMSEIELVGWNERPPLWQHLFAFGGYSVPGGASPYFCVSRTEETIFVVDAEANDHTVPLNGTVRQFIECFKAVDEALGQKAIGVDVALRTLAKIDRSAFDKGSEWRTFLEHAKS